VAQVPAPPDASAWLSDTRSRQYWRCVCSAAAERALANHDAGPVTVIDDRRVERLRGAKAETLHVGMANYCWFSDPTKAHCLKPRVDRNAV
jgi:hypothetical protein